MKSGAIIYIRVSTAEQVENNSLTNQHEACLTYCQQNDLEALQVFSDEGHSAKIRERPALLHALDFCKRNKGKVHTFLVWKLDRFSRNQSDHHALRAIIAGYGVALRSVTEILRDDPTGHLMEGILAAFAQFDNDIRGQRAVVGMVASLRKGRWTFKAPVGLLNKKDEHGNPTLAICPDSGPLVKEGFEMFSTSRYTQTQLLDHLSQAGLRNHRGNRLNPQALSKMLQNGLYAGWIESSLIGTEKVRGNFEPLVDQELFDRCQAVRLKKQQGQSASRFRDNPDFPLRGFVKCGACGKPLTASWSRGNGGRYPYYRCHGKGCGVVNVRRNRMDDLFCEYLKRLKPKPSYFSLFRAIVTDVWKEKQSYILAEREAVAREVEKLKGRKQRLVDLLVSGALDEGTYGDQIERVQNEIIVKQMESTDVEIEHLDIEAVLNFAEHLILDCERLWTEANLDQKQRLQAAFFPEGISYLQGAIGTTSISTIFNRLEVIRSHKSALACRELPGWNHIKGILETFEGLRLTFKVA